MKDSNILRKIGIILMAVVFIALDVFLTYSGLTVPIDGTIGILPTTVILICVMNFVVFVMLCVCKFLWDDLG